MGEMETVEAEKMGWLDLPRGTSYPTFPYSKFKPYNKEMRAREELALGHFMQKCEISFRRSQKACNFPYRN